MLAVIVGTLAFLVAASAKPPATESSPFRRNWSAHPSIFEHVSDNQDIYALGDTHGDYDKTVKLLAGAKLIAANPAAPKDAAWTAGKSILVCTGDMIDKWNQGIEIIQLLQTLQTSAQKSGGMVIVTLGNHEAEFLGSKGDKKKAAEFVDELQTRHIAPADVIAGTDALGLGDWLRNLPVAAKVDGWFFCHAGNTFGMSLKELRQSFEAGIDKDGFGTYVLSEPNSILEARLSPVPWWIMNVPASQPAQDNPPATAPSGAAILKSYLQALGCAHMVIGHQPGKVSFGGGVERKAGEPFTYEGLLFMIDVGMSRGQQDGHGILLKIPAGQRERAQVIDDADKEKTLWPAQ